MANTPLVVEKTLHASPERIWQALVDKDQIAHWSFQMDAFEPVVGFEFTFAGENEGRKFQHVCIVTEVVPGRKLSYSWRYIGYPGSSLVTFELFPEGSGTRVRVTHEGLDTFPRDNPDFSVKNFTMGWTGIVDKALRKWVEAA